MSAHSVWLVEYGYVDRFPASNLFAAQPNEGFRRMPYCFGVIRTADECILVDAGFWDPAIHERLTAKYGLFAGDNVYVYENIEGLRGDGVYAPISMATGSPATWLTVTDDALRTVGGATGRVLPFHDTAVWQRFPSREYSDGLHVAEVALAPGHASVLAHDFAAASSSASTRSATRTDSSAGRGAAVGGRLEEDFLDLGDRAAVPDGAADVRRELVHPVQGGQQAEVHQAARAPVESGPRPDVIPARRRDKLLQRAGRNRWPVPATGRRDHPREPRAGPGYRGADVRCRLRSWSCSKGAALRMTIIQPTPSPPLGTEITLTPGAKTTARSGYALRPPLRPCHGPRPPRKSESFIRTDRGASL
jgi:hypothetical protein